MLVLAFPFYEMSVSVTKLTNPYFCILGLTSVTNTEEYGGCTGLVTLHVLKQLMHGFMHFDNAPA